MKECTFLAVQLVGRNVAVKNERTLQDHVSQDIEEYAEYCHLISTHNGKSGMSSIHKSKGVTSRSCAVSVLLNLQSIEHTIDEFERSLMDK